MSNTCADSPRLKEEGRELEWLSRLCMRPIFRKADPIRILSSAIEREAPAVNEYPDARYWKISSLKYWPLTPAEKLPSCRAYAHAREMYPMEKFPAEGPGRSLASNPYEDWLYSSREITEQSMA